MFQLASAEHDQQTTVEASRMTELGALQQQMTSLEEDMRRQALIAEAVVRQVSGLRLVMACCW